MDVTPFNVGKLLSGLVDRPVQAARADVQDFSTKLIFGEYEVVPDGHYALAKLDLSLLAMLGGIMIALPAKQIETQVAQGVMDAELTDASREILNVLSTVMSESRAVFQKSTTREVELNANSKKLLIGQPLVRLPLRLTVGGAKAGCMTILSST